MKLWGDGKISNAQYCYTYLLINSIQKSLITQVCNFPLRVKEPARSEKAPKQEGKLDILRPGDFFYNWTPTFTVTSKVGIQNCGKINLKRKKIESTYSDNFGFWGGL